MTIRVMLVDDHVVVSEGVTTLLSQLDDLDVVGAVQTGEEAVARCVELRPDVVLMDLSMPGMDGAEATRRIIEACPETRVVILTGFLDEASVRDAMGAGASGYLMKSIGGRELADAIRAAVQGRGTVSLEAMPGVFASIQVAEPAGDLTRREREVLGQLAEGASNKEIAGALALSPGTVRVHVSNILSKLGVANRTAAASFAFQNGLVPRGRD